MNAFRFDALFLGLVIVALRDPCRTGSQRLLVLRTTRLLAQSVSVFASESRDCECN